jgi:hydroxypyruvate reductase
MAGAGSDPAMEARELLIRLFERAVARALPAGLFDGRLPDPPAGRTLVIGAGKAAASMAQAFERAWDAPLAGMVVTRYGHGAACERIEVVEAAHPVPDEAGRAATLRMLAATAQMGPDDLVVCLISGGGSALLAAPAGPLTLDDEQAVTRALLRSGAPIGAINIVRKHMSAVKGGRLALAAAPARVCTYVISDIPGDDPAQVASGPTFADPTSRHDALAILDRYRIAAPAVRGWLGNPESETPKSLPAAQHFVIATARDALDAAADAARNHGYHPVILGDAIEGEAREVARAHAAIAKAVRAGNGIAAPPCVLLSGGETSVTVRGGGRGGRNAEYLLALALELGGTPGISALAADTDGLDGTEDNAGAIMGPETLAMAAKRGIDASAALANNDGYGFFAELDALLITGPTRTNVNDFRAILIDPN